MELGMKAEDIMNRDFPVLDSSLDLDVCVKNINNHEACVVLRNGFLHSVLSYDDILKAFLKKKAKIMDIKSSQDFAVVKPETDVSEIIRIMTKGRINFVIVREGNYLGLITKKEIAEINQVLFDMLDFRDKNMISIGIQ